MWVHLALKATALAATAPPTGTSASLTRPFGAEPAGPEAVEAGSDAPPEASPPPEPPHAESAPAATTRPVASRGRRPRSSPGSRGGQAAETDASGREDAVMVARLLVGS